jgi:2-oxoglutarate ferredoxin oxidoreductase subunit beta
MEIKDYTSDRQVKYCAGCGDYSVLMTMKRTFAELNLQPKDIAVISGIGCSSRTPYYLSTWGFNTIHGRAGAIASGLKIARPDLVFGNAQVMVIVWQLEEITLYMKFVEILM